MKRRTLSDHPKGEAWVVATVIRMRDQGCKLAEIAAFVTFGQMTVSRILCENGRRNKTRGVRKPRREIGATYKRVCMDCGLIEMIRSDHKHTKRCASCARAATVFQKGHRPANAGSTERQRERTCRTCGAKFFRSESYMTKRPKNYQWGSYCSKPCYGIAMQTPGSRYSEVGKNYPSRGRR